MEQANEITESKFQQPKFSNHKAGQAINGANNRDNGSVFDQHDGGILSPPKYQRAVAKPGQSDQSDLQQENQILKDEMQKMREQMSRMEKVSVVTIKLRITVTAFKTFFISITN